MDPQDLLWLAVAAAVVVDDMQRTTEVLRRAIGDHAELDRLNTDTRHLTSLLCAFQKALGGERASDRLDELPDLGLVKPRDDTALLERLLLVADSGEQLGESRLDVA